MYVCVCMHCPEDIQIDESTWHSVVFSCISRGVFTLHLFCTIFQISALFVFPFVFLFHFSIFLHPPLVLPPCPPPFPPFLSCRLFAPPATLPIPNTHVSTSTLALLLYFHVYCNPVALFPCLLLPYCFNFTTTMDLLPCAFSASIFHKNSHFTPSSEGI